MLAILLLSLALPQVSGKECADQCSKGSGVELWKECERQGSPRERCKEMIEESVKQCKQACATLDKKR